MPLKSTYPAFPAVERGKPTVLKLSPKRDKLLYGHGNIVIIRDVVPPPGGPIQTQVYAGHSYPVTAVEMAPSGCYCASGDSSGVLRIWACDHPDQILKLETPLFGGKILDISWSADSQRLVGVGEGSALYGKVIMWDSGNSVGEISGHSKHINSCSFKSSRPFRIVTGGEDNKVGFFEGPPFKYKATAHTHERFVNTVRFSPSGDFFYSASSDGSLALYDGKTGELVGEPKKLHGGSIYCAAWSPDGTQILTSSGDGTAKVVKVPDLAEVATLELKSGDRSKTVFEQQVAASLARGATPSTTPLALATSHHTHPPSLPRHHAAP